MPVEMREVRAFEGPNIYYPQPAVKLVIWAERDMSRQITDLVKTWAQMTGLVIGYLRSQGAPDAGGVRTTTTWTTPLPTVGARVATQVAADLQATEADDPDYDHDEALFATIAERKRQEPSLALLQLLAEARAYDLPVLRRADGHLVIGSGARGWSFDPAGLSLGLNPDVPWENVGTVPVVAVTGPDAAEVTRLVAALVETPDQRVGRAAHDGLYIAGEQLSNQPSATWEGARRVLTDHAVDLAIIETSVGDMLMHGLGFDQCRVSVVTGIAGVDEPDSSAAHGLIVLTTTSDGQVVLNADEPMVRDLGEWASAPQMLYSATRPPAPPDQPWLYSDGATIQLMGAGQSIPLALPASTAPASQLLPALAAAYALGINIATLEQL